MGVRGQRPRIGVKGLAPWALSGAIPTGVNFRALARKEGQSPCSLQGQVIISEKWYNLLHH